MTHGPNDRAGAPGASGRFEHTTRPVRLSRGDAKRVAAELLDDVLRGGERAHGAGVSNASVAASLDLSESRVRKLRDPHEEATFCFCPKSSRVRSSPRCAPDAATSTATRSRRSPPKTRRT